MYFNESLLDRRVTFLQYQHFGEHQFSLTELHLSNLITGSNLTRMRFATATNSTFQYDTGFSNDVLYPG